MKLRLMSQTGQRRIEQHDTLLNAGNHFNLDGLFFTLYLSVD
jgi:hypothetical protein